MPQTWPLTVGPNFPVGKEMQPRNLVSEFGDGFEARSGDGINTMKDKWGLRWANLSCAEKDAAEDFLKARAGVENFLWTPPGGEAERRVVCKAWNITQTDVDSFTLTADFERDFNP